MNRFKIDESIVYNFLYRYLHRSISRSLSPVQSVPVIVLPVVLIVSALRPSPAFFTSLYVFSLTVPLLISILVISAFCIPIFISLVVLDVGFVVVSSMGLIVAALMIAVTVVAITVLAMLIVMVIMALNITVVVMIGVVISVVIMFVATIVLPSLIVVIRNIHLFSSLFLLLQSLRLNLYLGSQHFGSIRRLLFKTAFRQLNAPTFQHLFYCMDLIITRKLLDQGHQLIDDGCIRVYQLSVYFGGLVVGKRGSLILILGYLFLHFSGAFGAFDFSYVQSSAEGQHFQVVVFSVPGVVEEVLKVEEVILVVKFLVLEVVVFQEALQASDSLASPARYVVDEYFMLADLAD